MLAWLALADRAALAGIARHWRGSLGAGALGAARLALLVHRFLALTAAANVRTLALVEVVMAWARLGPHLPRRREARVNSWAWA